jgi:hypothetical protein
MLPRGRRIAAAVSLLALLALLPASVSNATTIGSNLLAAPNGGVCPLSGAGETSCSYVQAALADDHAAPGGAQPEGLFGVITSWKIFTAAPSPATTGVKARLRIIEGGGVPYAYEATPYEELPLGEPGVHVFPARLAIDEYRQAIDIDVAVTGNGSGEAAAPFAYQPSRIGDVWKWSPGLSEGVLPLSDGEGDLELLFNARVERDRDRDGYGDMTQDRCPRDRKRHAHCMAPRREATQKR